MIDDLFYDINQANLYLSRSLVRYNDIPFYIREISGTANLKPTYLAHGYSLLNKKKLESINLYDPKFNFKPVPLGMLVTDIKDGYNNSSFIARTPTRITKLGLFPDNLHLYNINKIIPIDYSRSELLLSNSLLRTILNQYPTLEEAFEYTDKAGAIVAINRKFAIQGKHLFYKTLGIPIGEIQKEIKHVKLFEEFFYLAQVIKEMDLNV